MHLDVDAAVIGAGVVGLAVARALALSGRDVVVLEAESALGTHASSRNSEVIHAGIYYEPGSLKARLCVRGRGALYRYCAERGVPHRRLGKVIVAVSENELPTLEKYRLRALENGVTDLALLDVADVRALEPTVLACGGLFSPSTGIVDSHELMHAYRRDAEAQGAHVLLRTTVLAGRVGASRIELDVGGPDPATLSCRAVVNAAGLFAERVATSLRGLDRATIPRTYFAKGHYFVLPGPSPFQRLVYPLPVPGGLGVHVTLDLAGCARFGPDVAYQDDIDYAFDEARHAAFVESIARYYPAIEGAKLVPGYTGIRAKLSAEGGPVRDFLVQGPEAHGVPALVNLYGIESPGLTASLALAEEVLSLLGPT